MSGERAKFPPKVAANETGTIARDQAATAAARVRATEEGKKSEPPPAPKQHAWNQHAAAALALSQWKDGSEKA